MAKPQEIYTRLTRPAGGVGTYTTLWMAHDHLLIVQSTGFTEEYARVRFRDIKGFFLVKSDRQFWWGAAWGIATLISLLLFLFARGNTVPVFPYFFLIPSVIGFSWNVLLGASCRAFIVTGVQTARLPSVVRRRKAERLIARLDPLIRAEQATLAAPPSVIPSVAPETPVPPPLT